MTIEEYKHILISNEAVTTSRALFGDEWPVQDDLYMMSIILWLLDNQWWYGLDEDRHEGLYRCIDNIILSNPSISMTYTLDNKGVDANIIDMPPIKMVEYDIDGVETSVDGLPHFFGVTAFMSVNSVEYPILSPLAVAGLVKPTNTYTHDGSPVYNKSLLIAFPKTFGSVLSVVDGNNVSLHGSYEWVDKLITIPGVGEVLYTIGGPKRPQMYVATTIVKWNIV